MPSQEIIPTPPLAVAFAYLEWGILRGVGQSSQRHPRRPLRTWSPMIKPIYTNSEVYRMRGKQTIPLHEDVTSSVGRRALICRHSEDTEGSTYMHISEVRILFTPDHPKVGIVTSLDRERSRALSLVYSTHRRDGRQGSKSGASQRGISKSTHTCYLPRSSTSSFYNTRTSCSTTCNPSVGTCSILLST